MNKDEFRREAEALLSMSSVERRKYLLQKRTVSIRDILEFFYAKLLYAHKGDQEAVREAEELLQFAKSKFREQRGKERNNNGSFR